ncbi:MAG: ATP-dependent DNA helicase [Proteobacteria bacterium]|nr:ATP-dependent DNA helicase [Pseudomonadota bacterium]
MSSAVARALEDNRPLIVEAGTRTGKTLAYLIPALQSGKRIVVSTGTRALQDQIARHDIPLLRTILEQPFSAVVLKGVSNYACRRKLEDARVRIGGTSINALHDWASDSETGDRGEVEWLAEDAVEWTAITTTPDARVGPRCPYFERCFVTRARRLAENAQLILVNHALYFADRAIRAQRTGGRVLPDHDAVIFDEAHQLEDVATEHFGRRVSSRRVEELARDSSLAMAGMPLWTGREAIDAIRNVERTSVAMFSTLRPMLVGKGDDRLPLPEGLFDHPDRRSRWFELDTALEDLARVSETDGDATPDAEHGEVGEATSRSVLTGIARRAREIRDDLATLAEQRQKNHVYWGDTRATNTTLAASPIDIAELFRKHVVASGPTPIFTSATLAAAGDFAYTRARLGLHDADELLVSSPFDYSKQAMLYVPRDLPAPMDDTFSAAAAQRIRELLAITVGHAFLLFTSHRALRAAATLLADLPYPRFVQGDAPRASLVDRFRATPHAVLFGTGSFWEGVDVPGDALGLVVIDKLPFAPHTEPLVAARMAACAQTNADPFATIQVPAAAISLKQGFGRLIRRRDDRGIVAVLDHRIVTKAYGRTFLATLPPELPRTSSIEQVRRWWSPAVGQGRHDLPRDAAKQGGDRLAADHEVVPVEIA